MYTNSSMTIYRKHYNSVERRDIYHRVLVDKVFWSSTDAHSVSHTNQTSDSNVKIFIPIKEANFDAASDKLVSDGDIIVKGETHRDIEQIGDLGEHYTVSSVSRKDFGSSEMRHWVVIAK